MEPNDRVNSLWSRLWDARLIDDIGIQQLTASTAFTVTTRSSGRRSIPSKAVALEITPVAITSDFDEARTTSTANPEIATSADGGTLMVRVQK